MFNCPLCDNISSERKTLSCHLTRKHSSEIDTPLDKERLIVYTVFTEELVEKTVKSYLDCEFPLYRSPINIAKYIELLGVKRTHSEEKKTARYGDQVSKSLEEKYGIKVTNVSQVPQIKEKIRKASKENYPKQAESMMIGFSKFLQDPDKVREAALRIQNTCLQRYGVTNFGQGEEARGKADTSRRAFIDGLSYQERLERTSAARKAVCHRGGYSSGPEIRVQKCIEIMGIKAQHNVHKWHYNFDIVWEDNILEVQGDMWHANPLFYKPGDIIMGKLPVEAIWEKDRKKRELALSNGFSLYEIWEHEIRSCKTDEQLLLKLQQLIES